MAVYARQRVNCSIMRLIVNDREKEVRFVDTLKTSHKFDFYVVVSCRFLSGQMH